MSRVIGINLAMARYKSIDGLRGYLAFFVFLHHSVIWYYYLRSDQWVVPPSRIYNHFGPASVSLFFMITSFLFFSKLLEYKGSSLDWVKLYVSRFLRILPLYSFVLSILFIVVACLTQWKLNEPIAKIASECLQWVAFMEPDINRVAGTRLIVAGVVWSLAFEWAFYFSLPFLGVLLFRIGTSAGTLIFSGILLFIFVIIILEFYPYEAIGRAIPFLGGIAAAMIEKNARIRKLSSSVYASFLVIILLLIVVFYYPSIYSAVPLMCLSLVFFAIACGNTLFGILSHNVSCLLGQISYSIYLLHGMVLFIMFRFVFDSEHAKEQSPIVHWITIAGSCVVLIAVCSLTYRYIERPCLNATTTVVAKLKSNFKAKQLA